MHQPWGGTEGLKPPPEHPPHPPGRQGRLLPTCRMSPEPNTLPVSWKGHKETGAKATRCPGRAGVTPRDTQPSCASLGVPVTNSHSLRRTQGTQAPQAQLSQRGKLPLQHSTASPQPSQRAAGSLRVQEPWGSPPLALLPRARQGSSAEVGIPSKTVNRAPRHLTSPGKGLGDLGQRNSKSGFGDALLPQDRGVWAAGAPTELPGRM